MLDRTSDHDHHRSVLTFAGRPHAVLEAAVLAARLARDSIDLNQHRGVHPRIGALDVLPFIPLGTASMEDCIALAHQAGDRIACELGLPVYFYGEAARLPARRLLENVRHGQFEALREAALLDNTRAPDCGGPAFHPTAGAIAVGARKILIAFNINLQSTDLALARSIARHIRASSGGFPSVKALGLPLVSRNLVQVSMNLTDVEQTSLPVVYAAVQDHATAAGASIEETELIGLWPRAVYQSALAHGIKMPRDGSQRIIEDRIRPFLDTIQFPGPFLAGEKTC
jgi:glutamate formiminotransferase